MHTNETYPEPSDEQLEAVEKTLALQAAYGVDVPSLSWYIKKWDDGTFLIAQNYGWVYDEQGRQTHFTTEWFYQDTIHDAIWRCAAWFAESMTDFQTVYFVWWNYVKPPVK